MKVMILAAGRGERLRPLTDTLPKPLLEVDGETLIERHLRRLQATGFVEVVINVAWLAAQIKLRLGDGARYGVHIRYSEEPEGALDTGGGIFKALPLLGPEPFLVVNADVHTDFPFASLRTVLAVNDLVHLVMVPNPPQHARGDFVLDAGGRLHAEGEARLTYTGVGVHRPDFFRECSPGKFPMLPLWRRAMCAGRAGGQLYTGPWHDLGTLEALREFGTVNS